MIKNEHSWSILHKYFRKIKTIEKKTLLTIKHESNRKYLTMTMKSLLSRKN